MKTFKVIGIALGLALAAHKAIAEILKIVN